MLCWLVKTKRPLKTWTSKAGHMTHPLTSELESTGSKYLEVTLGFIPSPFSVEVESLWVTESTGRLFTVNKSSATGNKLIFNKNRRAQLELLKTRQQLLTLLVTTNNSLRDSIITDLNLNCRLTSLSNSLLPLLECK